MNSFSNAGNMLAQEIIRRKRDRNRLTRAELDFVAKGIANDTFSEGQAAAFAMAVYFCGMEVTEIADWTSAVTASGERLRWQRDRFDGPLLDKHSTGGVGDKVSLILAPLLAACGANVPMISGRGLGHTGGTLDKLEAIPGFKTRYDHQGLHKLVEDVGCAIVGASDSIAPADRRLYSIRDVTATVDSVPLMTASILSKKLAASLEGLVLDVKTGSGAFAPTLEDAQLFAESLVGVANQAGLPTVALLTDMNQVLGTTAGNALEVLETIDFLTSRVRDSRLEQAVIATGVEALLLGGLAHTVTAAQTMLGEHLADGSAAQRFQTMVEAQGGPADLLEKPQAYLGNAEVVHPVYPTTDGLVERIDVRKIGIAVITLGGGRKSPGDAIDPHVGFSDIAGIGQNVSPHEPLAMVHAANEGDAEYAANKLRAAFHIGPIGSSNSSPSPLVIDRIDTEY